MNSIQLSVAEQIAFLREEIRRQPPKFAEMFCKEQLEYTASWLPRGTLDYAARTEFADLFNNKYRLRVDPYIFPRMSVVKECCPIDLVKRLHALRGSGRRMKSLEAAAAQLVEEMYFRDQDQRVDGESGTLTDHRFILFVQQVLKIEQALGLVVNLDDPVFRARGNREAGLQPDLSPVLKLLRGEQEEVADNVIEFLRNLLLGREPYYFRFIDRQGPPQDHWQVVIRYYLEARQKIHNERMRKLRMLARKSGSNGMEIGKLRRLFPPAPSSPVSDHRVAIQIVSNKFPLSEKQISRILSSSEVSLFWMEWRLRDYLHPENQSLLSGIPDINPPAVGQ